MCRKTHTLTHAVALCIVVLGSIEDLHGPACRSNGGPGREVDAFQGRSGRGYDGACEGPGGHSRGVHASRAVPPGNQEVHSGRKQDEGSMTLGI